MSERVRMLELLERAHGGDPWHGSARAAILAGVTAAEAAAHPVRGAHSIWELVLHMTAWTWEVARRLRGEPAAEPELGDWPTVGEVSESAWVGALEALDAAHAEVLASVREMPEARWDERVGELRDPVLGTGVTYADMLAGLLQHDAYHSGQVALLKKAAHGASAVAAPRAT